MNIVPKPYAMSYSNSGSFIMVLIMSRTNHILPTIFSAFIAGEMQKDFTDLGV